MTPGPRVDDRSAAPADDLAERYEAERAAALDGRAGLGAALLMAQGMASWMRGWRACTPPAPRPTAPVGNGPGGEVVGVLAAMALACTQGG